MFASTMAFKCENDEWLSAAENNSSNFKMN